MNELEKSFAVRRADRLAEEAKAKAEATCMANEHILMTINRLPLGVFEFVDLPEDVKAAFETATPINSRKLIGDMDEQIWDGSVPEEIKVLRDKQEAERVEAARALSMRIYDGR